MSGVSNGGGGGNNMLDYSAYTGGVTVNLGNATTGLANDSATGVNGGGASGISNISNVIVGAGNNYLAAVGVTTNVTFTATGNGNNILVGGSGSNTLTVSGSGNNIVIGDRGATTLSGGTGYNLLIGGYTAYDAAYADLESILGIWKTVSSATRYATAISKLTASSYAYRSIAFCHGTRQRQRHDQRRDTCPGLVLRCIGGRDRRKEYWRNAYPVLMRRQGRWSGAADGHALRPGRDVSTGR